MTTSAKRKVYRFFLQSFNEPKRGKNCLTFGTHVTNRHNVQMVYEELRAIHKFLSFDVYIAFGSRTSHIEQHGNVSRRSNRIAEFVRVTDRESCINSFVIVYYSSNSSRPCLKVYIHHGCTVLFIIREVLHG